MPSFSDDPFRFLLHGENDVGKGIPKRFLYLFNAACKLYTQALRNAENEDETAYLNLVMAGEILSQYEMHKIKKDTKKERFARTLSELLDDKFFLSTESRVYDKLHGFGFFKRNGADFKKHLQRAYELRNKYVHEGIPFGKWIRPHNSCEDILTGTPVVDEDIKQIVSGYAEIIKDAPTFIGLERTIRYCLLKMLENNHYSVQPNPTDQKEETKS